MQHALLCSLLIWRFCESIKLQEWSKVEIAFQNKINAQEENQMLQH